MPIIFPKELYVGMITRPEDDLPLGFACPHGTDSAAKKRMASVDKWVGENLTSWDYQNQQRITRERIPPVVMKNEALSGYRLLDVVVRHSRQGTSTKWRIEDPRGFELEIKSENLMQILTDSVIDQGEILDQCMWARDGSNNVLVPVTSPVYKEAFANTARSDTKVSMKDVKLGDTLILQNGVRGRYLGKMCAVNIENYYYFQQRGRDLKPKWTKRHVLYCESEDRNYIVTYASLKIGEIVPGEELTKDDVTNLLKTYHHDVDFGERYYWQESPINISVETRPVPCGNDGVYKIGDSYYLTKFLYSPRIDQYKISTHLWETEKKIEHIYDNYYFRSTQTPLVPTSDGETVVLKVEFPDGTVYLPNE